MIGLGTYAFFWQHSDRVAEPLSLDRRASRPPRAQDVDLFQICDYAPLLSRWTTAELDGCRSRRRATSASRSNSARRASSPATSRASSSLADVFDARLVRSMLYSPRQSRPTLDEAERMAAHGAAGVRGIRGRHSPSRRTSRSPPPTSSASSSASASERLGHLPRPGERRRPARAAARLPSSAARRCTSRTCTSRTSPSPARTAGWASPTAARRWATGLHDYPHLIEKVRPAERGISRIVEHWLTWQDDAATTVATENQWINYHNLNFLRSN